MDRTLITKEILEKNGFEVQTENLNGCQVCTREEMYRWFHADPDSYYTGYESVHIDLSDNYMNVTKEDKDGKQCQVRGIFQYVDQLQTALTLVGINKTIEL